MRLLQTKKDEHTFTLADWWRDEVYPKILKRGTNFLSYELCLTINAKLS